MLPIICNFSKTLTMKGLMFRNSYLTFHNESLNTDKRPSANNNNAPGSANERERLGRGGPRPYVRNSGVCYPFGFNITLNTIKKQVIPVGFHNFSKSFRPNMATIRVLSLGTKCTVCGQMWCNQIMEKTVVWCCGILLSQKYLQKMHSESAKK